ncbi:hypothetical protein [Actinophytocola gossypii]|uniref:Ig-like domain-containing protein n=1 Tax=Actinophytocola gossypii TaxID=2812003 RepID=A0ABT2J531_9PSEU|nr:hypothetical protein [Actinophytocola gossypii]MCT2582968.1 hypothetical protein [Actinophytocola gossypii]
MRSYDCQAVARLSHWTNWVELVSWVAGIFAALFGIAMTVQASNSSRMKATLELAEPFVRALALSLDKPELLAAYESESKTAKEILRKRTRRKLVRLGLVLGALGMVAGVSLLLSQVYQPRSANGLRFAVGDAAQQQCEQRGLGSVANILCTNRWSLNSSEQEIEAQATFPSPGREADLDIAVRGCSGRAQVQWELLADGELLGRGVTGSDSSEQISDVPASVSALTVRAERIDDDSCSAELVVEAVVWL